MPTQTITNTFLSGSMNTDSLVSMQPQNSWRLLRNGQTKSRYNRNFGLVQIESNKKVAEVTGGIVGAAFIESMDATIIFSKEGAGTIYLFHHDDDREDGERLEKVASASEFGCNWLSDDCECHWINPTVKTMQPCNEEHVYWSNGEDYFVANLAELRDPKRKAALQACIQNGENGDGTECGYSCDHFMLMNCVCSPYLRPIALDSGGELANGIYQFVVQLEDNSGNTTNWFTVSNKVSIAGGNNLPGEFSGKSIAVNMFGLDCKYDRVRIAVIKNGTTAEVLTERGINTDHISFTYTGQEGESIDIREITTKKKAYIKGKEATQKDGRLWLWKIQPEINPNLQARVISEVQIKFKEFIRTARYAEKYALPSLERDEGYLFAIVYNYCDGTHSPAFLASPSGGGGGRQTPSDSDGTTTVSGFAPDGGGSSGSGSGAGTTSFVEPTAVQTEKFIRERKKTGLIGPTLPHELTSQDPKFPQIDDTHTTESESGVAANLAAWITSIPNVVEAAKCNNCLEAQSVDPRGCCVEILDDDGEPTGEMEWMAAPESIGVYKSADLNDEKCAGCTEDETAIDNDLPKVQNISVRHTDDLAHLLEGGTKQTKDKTDYTSATWKDAAIRLTNAVDNMERFEKTEQISNIDVTVQGGSSSTTVNSASGGSGSSATQLNDEHTINNEATTEGLPRAGQIFEPTIKTTDQRYPDGKDCNGEFLYGGKANSPVEIFFTPTPAESPIMIPKVTGVPSPESPGVDPIYDNDVVALGIDVSGVPVFPNVDDQIEVFGKPLCPNEPWRVVMVPRDAENATVQAKGIFTGSFEGVMYGKTQFYPKLGLNGPTYVDRFIDDDGSREGSGSSSPVYNFHSLAANTNKVGLTGNKVNIYGKFTGQGYRYGLYAKGQDPQLPLIGRRVDQRGARSYININTFEPSEQLDVPITGLSYIPANRVVDIPNTDVTMSNRYRESSVGLVLGASIGREDDKSFISDGYNHAAPIKEGFAWYGAIKRDRPNQYGSVVGMKFIDTGVTSIGHGPVVQGICGDVFIGPHTFKRSSYVSDKVGDTFETPERDRTVCDSPNTADTQSLGLDYNPLEHPKSGDITDAKNWANGFVRGGRPLDWQEAADIGRQLSDNYYPKVQKTLVTTWEESRVNPWLRATGIGTGIETGEVYYPKLKGLHLDANDYAVHPWEESYIPRFYYEDSQPSKSQLIKKSLVKVIVETIIPFVGIEAILANFDTATTTVASLAFLPLLVAYWYYSEQVLTNDQYLNNMLDIPTCNTDTTGGETDSKIRQFEDNYYEYNNLYSYPNYINYYQSMSQLYNTCICSSCDHWTNEVYFSNKQLQNSQFDSYRNFKALNYVSIPPDLGKLTNLFSMEGNFFFHTTDGIGVVKYREISTQTNVGLSLLGGNELMFSPTIYLEGVREGFAGLQNTNSSKVTKYGYFWQDEEARKVFRLRGLGLPEEISNYANDSLHRLNIPFCDKSECHGEHTPDGTGITISFDPRYDNVILSKKDGPDGNSFSLLYDPEKQTTELVSIMDWVADASFNDRSDLYTIKDGGIWLHNAEDGKYLNMYGEPQVFEVEVISASPLNDLKYESTILRAETRKGDVLNVDELFTHLDVFNSTQAAQYKVDLLSDNKGSREDRLSEIEETSDLRVTKISKNKYKFNKIKDMVISDCEDRAITLRNDCDIFEELNTGILDCNATDDLTYGNRIFLDDHLRYRFRHSNQETEIKLISVETITGESEN